MTEMSGQAGLASASTFREEHSWSRARSEAARRVVAVLQRSPILPEHEDYSALAAEVLDALGIPPPLTGVLT